jgi:hypothetical protein
MFNVNDFDLTRTQWENLIDQHIFNERDRKLIKRRLLDGIHYEPLAEEFELSVQRTKDIVHKTKTRLFRYLK